MKEYKVEGRIYYSKLVANKDHISEKSRGEIQYLLDEYAKEGWTLVSTDATSFGSAMYIYLYFERESPE